MHAIVALLLVATLKAIGGGIGMHRLGIVVAIIVIGASLVALFQMVDLPGMLRAMHGG